MRRIDTSIEHSYLDGIPVGIFTLIDTMSQLQSNYLRCPLCDVSPSITANTPGLPDAPRLSTTLRRFLNKVWLCENNTRVKSQRIYSISDRDAVQEITPRDRTVQPQTAIVRVHGSYGRCGSANAVNALEQRPSWIEVAVAPSADRRWVEITVADNGRGMNAHEQRRAFEPGYTTKRRGWGLGLALSRSLARSVARRTRKVPRRSWRSMPPWW